MENTPKDRKEIARGVDELLLSIRAANILSNAGIETVEALVAWTPERLLKVRSCGRKTVRELQEALWGVGLKLGMTEDEIEEAKR